VSELRLKRRAAALELSELREREATKEATVAREALEEALVRLEEKGAHEARTAAAREAQLQSELASVKGALAAAALPPQPQAGEPPRLEPYFGIARMFGISSYDVN